MTFHLRQCISVYVYKSYCVACHPPIPPFHAIAYLLHYPVQQKGRRDLVKTACDAAYDYIKVVDGNRKPRAPYRS